MVERLTVGKLASVLHETEQAILARVLRTLGEERCVELLPAALLCEHHGGMWLKDQARKRTLGGVFFTLVKERSTEEERRKVFG